MEKVYEFRPLPDYFKGSFKRYANGLWIQDDGEYDLAFIGDAQNGFPLCLYFQTPYYKNIVCSWAGHCSNSIDRSWGHYALKAGTNDCDDYDNCNNHPNEIASRSGMSKKSSESGCCNGRSISFQFDDKHIAAGLLRDRDTKQVFEWSNISCYYCGDRPVQKEYNKALKHAIARHVALKRMEISHPIFNQCNCIELVREHVLMCG